MHLQRHFYHYTWIFIKTRKDFLSDPCPSLDYIIKTLIDVALTVDDTNSELGTQKLAPVTLFLIFLGPTKQLKRIAPQKLFCLNLNLLYRNGVWYSLFWSEGPKNHQNRRKNWSQSLSPGISRSVRHPLRSYGAAPRGPREKL